MCRSCQSHEPGSQSSLIIMPRKSKKCSFRHWRCKLFLHASFLTVSLQSVIASAHKAFSNSTRSILRKLLMYFLLSSVHSPHFSPGGFVFWRRRQLGSGILEASRRQLGSGILRAAAKCEAATKQNLGQNSRCDDNADGHSNGSRCSRYKPVSYTHLTLPTKRIV